jgi:glyceronephosphate O-acyltransferase
MALEPYFMGEIHNLKIVPISISYEKPLEEQLFVYELLGIPKPKESTMGFLKALATLKNNNYGRMFFDFGKPIDLNEFFGTKLDKFKYASEPAHVQNLGDEDLGLTVDLAHFVVRQQQKKIVITIFNLMSLIYNEKVFTVSAKNVSVAEMKDRVLAVAELFDDLGAIVSLNHNDLSQDMNNALKIHTNILELGGSSNAYLKLIKAKTTSTRNETKVKGHMLCTQVMDISVPVFSLQIYCNPTLFWLAEPAFFVLCLKGIDELTENELRENVKKLRELFIYEFVMHSSFEASDFETTLSTLLRQQIIKQQSSNSYHLNEQSPNVTFLLSAISPFLNCYLNTASIINDELQGKTFVDKEVFIIVQSHLEQEILKENHCVHPYALCLESITTTLLSLCNTKSLNKEKRNSVNHYTVNADKLQVLVNDLRIYNSKLDFQYKYFDSIITPKM